MKTLERITNFVGAMLLIIFVLVAAVGYPQLVADNPDGTYTTANGNEVKNSDGLTAVIAIIAITALAYVLRGKSALLLLFAIIGLALWASKVNPQ